MIDCKHFMRVLLGVCSLAACGGGGVAGATETESAGTAVSEGDTEDNDGTAEAGEPTGGEDPEARQHGGRTPRRLSVDQVRAALLILLGETYRGGAWVFDPLDPQGGAWREDADLLDAFGGALGRPDYNYTVIESLEAGMTFAKFVQDAARDTCRRAVEADVAGSGDTRHVLLEVEAEDSLAGAEAAVRDNISALALRFWARDIEPASPEVDELIEVFSAAATAPEWIDETGATRPAGAPPDGWRAVCVAMATDAQFYVY